MISIETCICCGSPYCKLHELIYGSSRKRKATEDELQAPLCNQSHRWLHDHPDTEIDQKLKELAQRKYMENHTLDEYMARYRRNYIVGWYHDYDNDFDILIKEVAQQLREIAYGE